MDEKKLGLNSVISTSIGLIIAISCLVSLGQGAGEIGASFIIAMVIACGLNMLTMLSLSEMNALMPNITGGLSQYTLAAVGPFPTMVSMVGGYLIGNVLATGVESSIFAATMSEMLPFKIPSIMYSLIVAVLLTIPNLYGVDIFAKVQNLVVTLMIGSMLVLGLMGIFQLGTGTVVEQPLNTATDWKQVVSMTAVAFWLFIGAEYAIPISKNVKNANKNVPLGMILGLLLILVVQSIMVLGFHNYSSWSELKDSASPHLLYGENLLGYPGKVWMALVAGLAVISTQNSTINCLAEVCQGMEKTGMMPACFGKTNKRGVPYIGVIFISGLIFLFAYLSDGSSDAMSFLILVGSVFWMVSYILIHVDVIVMRRRWPKAPRNFKLKGGLLVPIVGIAGIVYMIINISTDPTERMQIWLLTAVTFVILSIYSFLWIKFKMKIPVFKSVPIKDVMAMENELYHVAKKQSMGAIKDEADNGNNKTGRKKNKRQ